MRRVLLAAVLGAMSLGGSRVNAARAQQSTLPNASTRTSNLPSIDGRGDSGPEDPTAAMRHAQMARLQNNERQKRIVDDSAKLLRLATELKEEVDKSNKDQMSLDVIRKAEEIERLAHDVKLRMKG